MRTMPLDEIKRIKRWFKMRNRYRHMRLYNKQEQDHDLVKSNAAL